MSPQEEEFAHDAADFPEWEPNPNFVPDEVSG